MSFFSGWPTPPQTTVVPRTLSVTRFAPLTRHVGDLALQRRRQHLHHGNRSQQGVSAQGVVGGGIDHGNTARSLVDLRVGDASRIHNV